MEIYTFHHTTVHVRPYNNETLLLCCSQPDDEDQVKPAKRAKLEEPKERTSSPLDIAQLKHYGEEPI